MTNNDDITTYFSDLKTEGLLKANASKENIIAGFADVLKDFLRAVASKQNHLSGATAAKNMSFLMEQVARCEEQISWNELFTHAVEELKTLKLHDAKDIAIIEAAQAGLLVLVEASCTDSAARGRFLQRQKTFLSQIKQLETNQSSFVKETLSALNKTDK